MLTDSQQQLLKLYCSDNCLQFLENACSAKPGTSTGETVADMGIVIPEALNPTRLQVIRSACSLVGIIVGRDDTGQLLICHCSGRADNIVIEPIHLTGCDVIATPFEFYDAY